MNQLISLAPRGKRMMYELKRHTPIHEWKQLQNVVAEFYGLNESDEVSDQQIEDLMMTIAKELKSAGKIDNVPTEIDVDKLEKGDESGIEIKESKNRLHEDITVSLLLAAPTLLKLFGRLIEWIYRKVTLSGEEEKAWEEQKAAFDYAKKTGKTIDGKPVTDKDIHHMEEALIKTKAGKFMISLSHKFHDAYISPLRLIIAGIQYMSFPEDSWMKAWKDSKRPANIIFAILMIGVAGYFGIHAVSEITNLSMSALSPIAAAVTDALKGGDMSIAVLKSILGHVHI
jgi:hypothetical protein